MGTITAALVEVVAVVAVGDVCGAVTVVVAAASASVVVDDVVSVVVEDA